MKRYLFSFVILCFFYSASGQLPFTTMDSIDINNINAGILVHGDMWWNPVTELAQCFYPKGTHKNIGFASGLWFSGFDNAGRLHASGQFYRIDGTDFWPGPLDADDTLTYATSSDWAKIWKVYRSDIQYFLSLTLHDSANTPQSILTWPGSGNVYARGNGGVTLALVAGETYAPFVDLNGDGIYEPLLGEYPDVPGDEALWWMFSDNGPTHNESNGKPMDIEVHATAYAYARGTLIDNVVYYKYDIVNKSVNDYDSFRLAQWANIDLGYYYDDFIGFDSTWRLGIQYNGTECDGCSVYPRTDTSTYYGSHIPMTGITIVHQPGDSSGYYIPAGAFTYFNNDFSVIGYPNDTQIYNYMHETYTIDTDEYSSACTPGRRWPVANTNYIFDGDPGNDSTWSECTSCNNPGDRRFILSTNDFKLPAGATRTIVLAQVTTAMDSPNACPHASFDSIGIYADTAWAVYQNPPPPLSVSGLASSVATMNIFPNPTQGLLHIDLSGTIGIVNISVINILGEQVLCQEVSKNGVMTVDVSSLPEGVYALRCATATGASVQQFVKN